MNRVINPSVPVGNEMEPRGIGSVAGVDPAMRKTGYRPDAQIQPTSNSNDPNALIRVNDDPRRT